MPCMNQKKFTKEELILFRVPTSGPLWQCRSPIVLFGLIRDDLDIFGDIFGHPDLKNNPLKRLEASSGRFQ